MSFNVAHTLGSKLRTRDVLLPDGSHTDFKSMLLPPPIIDGLTKAGFVQPSPIQLKAIPLARCGFDLIVQSKSGTGKTCVFTVAALDSLNIESKRLQALVLAPTREIALQIEYVIKAIGSQFSGLEVATLIGGLPLHKDKSRLQNGCQIVVGTPGRIRHCIELGWIELNAVRIFVLDEADMLMASSFQDDINVIFEDLPDSKQVLACSATYTPDLVSFLGNYMQSATHVAPSGEPCPVLLGLRHFVLISPDQSSNQLRKLKIKENQLISILKLVPFSQCLVFSNYQTRAESICQLLRRKGWSNCCEWIAGSQDQNTRIDVYERVRDFKARILLTTDLTARGLDFEAANLVINLDIPSDPHTYLHRMGRAGRFGGHGIVITLLTTDELSKFRTLIGKIGSYANSHIIPEHLLNKELWTADLDKLDIVEGDSESMEHKIIENSTSGIEDEIKSHSDNEDDNINTAELLEFGLKLLRFKKAPEFCSFKKLEESRQNYVGDVSNGKEAYKWRKVLEPPGSLDSDVAEYFIALYNRKSADVTEMCKTMYFVEAIKGLPDKSAITNEIIKSPKQEYSTTCDINLDKLEISVDQSIESGDEQSDRNGFDVMDRSASMQSVSSSSSSSCSHSIFSNSSEFTKSNRKNVEGETDNRLFDTETNAIKYSNIGHNEIKKPVQIFVPKRKLCELNSSSTSSEHCQNNEDFKHKNASSGQSNDYCSEEVVRKMKTQRKKKKQTTNPFVQSNNQGINSSYHHNNHDYNPTTTVSSDQWHALYAQQLSQLRMYTNYSYYMNRMLNSQNRHS